MKTTKRKCISKSKTYYILKGKKKERLKNKIFIQNLIFLVKRKNMEKERKFLLKN